jgi:kumamolisin
LYQFPQGTAEGECVALIELGGGFRPADLATYFTRLGVSAPVVTAMSVDHGANQPTGDPSGADGEVMLDIEVVGAVAPGVRIAVYFAPNTDAGFLNALTSATHDEVHKPSVISISWGGPESSWSAQAMTAMDHALQAAATLGITVCVACGDNGSSDGASGGSHVDFPASSPYALACGGTSLRAARQQIRSEVVWNDASKAGGASGGGVSAFFPLPSWQQGLAATTSAAGRTALAGRGVPDVAGDADPQTGYEVRIDGTDTVIGGTSAVAPLWAGLIAVANAGAARPLGYLNPLLYAHPSALRDITQGNNGAFKAAVGWDACTGLGSPIGQRVAVAISGPANG